MNRQDVIIYTCDNCSDCKKVIEKMDEWDIVYTMKSISDNKEYLSELQNKGIFGTPATFVDNHPILGYQENKLKSILNVGDSEQSFFRNFYEGYEDRKE